NNFNVLCHKKLHISKNEVDFIYFDVIIFDIKGIGGLFMINQANTAFVLISTILVFFMTPGLASFYGGLVSRKIVVITVFSVFVIGGFAILLFVSVGYVICSGKDVSGICGWGHSFFLSRNELTKMYTKSLAIDDGTNL